MLLVLVGASAAVAGDEAFEAWVSALRAEAEERKVSAGTLDAAFRDVTPNPKVIRLDRRQPEFEMDFAKYLTIVAPDSRVRTGRGLLDRHRALLEEVQGRFGVQPRFLVALWGVESDFGRRMGDFSIIRSLTTLAYDGRRAAFFRGELLDALQILEEGHIAPDRMLGSWAGAMGQPQFMPSSFRNFAVDQDGDDRRDIWSSIPDVLASAANYLARNGWDDNRTWGREIRLPEGFDASLTGRSVRKSISEWQKIGVRRLDGSALPLVDIEGSIVRPDGDVGRAFLVYANFGVLLSWNRSDYFATAVGLLSDAIAR